jgi:hypothetical protein
VLIAATTHGTGSRELGRFPGGVAFGFRPGGWELTVGVTHHPDTGIFEELLVLDLQERSPHARRFARGPFLAWAWNPSGAALAAVVPSHLGDGRQQLRAIDREGRVIAATEPFVPAPDFRTMLTFFDQYRLSHSWWTPRGDEIVICGRLPDNGISPSFGDATDYVYSWRPERGSPLELLGPGDHAACRPPA